MDSQVQRRTHVAKYTRAINKLLPIKMYKMESILDQ